MLMADDDDGLHILSHHPGSSTFLFWHLAPSIMKILITGATGNVGKAVIDHLVLVSRLINTDANDDEDRQLQVFAGVRDPDKSRFDPNQVTCTKFDFEDVQTMKEALDSTGCRVLFLVRPPQLANVQKYFQPLIDAAIARRKTIQHIVFLSVQGADANKHIPHAKIEQAIVASKIPYTFVRPAYFMQNFLQSPMFDELVVQPEHRVFLPTGHAKFTVIDVNDIGRAVAGILLSISSGQQIHVNKSYDLTNAEQLSFSEMAEILNDELPYTVTYTSPNPVRFFFVMRQRYQKLPRMFVTVMIMLHYLPRFQSEPPPTNADKVMELCALVDGNDVDTKQELTTFREFVQQHKQQLSKGVSGIKDR
jgi:uncharacterized protein YbjT (DUF2867 family)